MGKIYQKAARIHKENLGEQVFPQNQIQENRAGDPKVHQKTETTDFEGFFHCQPSCALWKTLGKQVFQQNPDFRKKHKDLPGVYQKGSTLQNVGFFRFTRNAHWRVPNPLVLTRW